MRVRATPTISREFEPGLGDALRSFAEWLQLEQGLTHREIEAKNGPMTTTTTLRDAAGLAQTLTRSDMVIEVESVELTVQHGETVRRDAVADAGHQLTVINAALACVSLTRRMWASVVG